MPLPAPSTWPDPGAAPCPLRHEANTRGITPEAACLELRYGLVWALRKPCWGWGLGERL